MTENDASSESSDTSTGLGEMPDAVTEPAEPNPGGPDALPRDDAEVVPADLPVEKNPAVDDAQTPALGEGEDTSTKATRDDASDTEDETPA